MARIKLLFILSISLVVYLLGFLFVALWDGPYYQADDLSLNYSEDLLSKGVEATADWYEFMTDKNNRLEYEFDPTENSFSNDNNEIRELASVWSMTELLRTVGANTLEAPLRQTLNHYLNKSVCEANYCYLDVEKSELAMNAFMVIGLVRLGEEKQEEKISTFVNGILLLQNTDGSYRPETDSSLVYGQDYYPGEAMLALMLAYEATDNELYLQSVEKAFPHYQTYWSLNKNTAFVPWQSQMGLLLYEATNDSEVADFVFDMNDWMIDNEQITVSNDPSLLGAFSKDDPRIATASMIEALVDAYKLAEIVGDEDRQTKYARSIKQALHYLFSLQAENGGWAHSLNNPKQRIDYAQHTVLGLIKILEYNILDYEPSL